MVVNEKLLDRIKTLENRLDAETSFITDSLVFSVAALLARDFPADRDHIIAHCEAVNPPENLNKEAIEEGFKILTDFFRDPDKKLMPDRLKLFLVERLVKMSLRD